MMIIGKVRNEKIGKLGLSDSLLKLSQGQFVHDELEFRCMEIKYSLEDEDFSPSKLDVVPLWESDSSITGFYLNSDNKAIFIHYYIDNIDEYQIIGDSESNLIDFLVSEYVDYDYEKEVRELLKIRN